MLGLLDAGLPAPAVGAFSTRRGGTSEGCWGELNLADHVADEPVRVAANRGRVAAETGTALRFTEQIHGTRVAVLDAGGAPTGASDGLVTTARGLALGVLAADCLPVLLADPLAGVVAAVHAGRVGLADGVLQEALRVMADCGARPEHTHAVLGPAVCGACYEVPAELAEQVARAVPGSRTQTRQGTPALDLSAGAERVLRARGCAVTRVGGCTLEQPDRFYSYRRDPITGRHAGLVWLR